MKNDFDNEVKYKLFRSVREILHPSISKKNISDYAVVVDEELLPLRVFYPKKITGVSKVIIFIHGNSKVTDSFGDYSDICRNLVKNTNHILIAIEYKDLRENYKELYQDVFDIVKFLYKELKRNGILSNDIVLMGDSTGANIVTGINYMNSDQIDIMKQILFYPVLFVDKYKNNSNSELEKKIKDYYINIVGDAELFDDELLNSKIYGDKYPNTLIILGNSDSSKSEILEMVGKYKNIQYNELPFSSYGFLNDMDSELEHDLKLVLDKFLK